MIEKRCVGISVRGAGHKKSNMPCQDAGRVRFTPQGILIAAVADGAGSARHSEVGAAIAVDAAMVKLEERFSVEELSGTDHDFRECLLDVTRVARQQVIDEARRLGVEKEDLACTLILCVASGTQVVVFHIGDGAVVVRTMDGVLQTLSAPANGEYFNETDFLTQPNFDACGRFSSCVGKLSDVAIITDGLELVAIDLRTFAPFDRFFNPLMDFFRQAESGDDIKMQIEEFLQSPLLCERTDDDLTLALASWIPKLSQE